MNNIVKKQRNNKGLFVRGNTTGFQPGNTLNAIIPQYNYVCTNCAYKGQYHKSAGGILNHFAHCTKPNKSDDKIQAIISNVKYPDLLLNNIAVGVDLGDYNQMTDYFTQVFRTNDKSNIPLLRVAFFFLVEHMGFEKFEL